eukprot:CAMPEP_0172755990 /NCGR_PEP_ID=MMETSP1074-20121228/160910_1 /TAXON_ID=2916 /ORGANISM="Ceratium fusus, Strain PA161109" /LENGTH=277 /DNA_ID=CAMNT_0013589175 /DNA_START=195 /DNA_END=1028 /DNA_ORIENTATION=-
MTGCFFNFVAMILLIVGSVGGLTTNSSVLLQLAWVKGKGEILFPTGPPVQIKTYIGLTSQHQQAACMNQAQVLLFVNATAGPRGAWAEGPPGCFERTFELADEGTCSHDSQEMVKLCEDCRESLLPSFTLFISIFAQIPTMATNLQRTTRFGDVNCQATMGVVSNLFSLFSSMVSLLSFRSYCMGELPETLLGNVNMKWHMGPGFQLVMLGTLVKLVDIACHCFVPTPKQRWKAPGEVRDTAAYLSLAPAEREQDTPTDSPKEQEEGSSSNVKHDSI